MADAGDSTPEGVTLDTSVAHPARVYDYWLGGKDNFAADREAAEQVIAANPTVLHGVRANRAFLGRAVRYLAAEAGIRQFLDLGTGLPTAQNTHQVAQEIAPDSRIVYVDNDPIVLAYARALLASAPEGVTAYVPSDIRDTEKVLAGAAQIGWIVAQWLIMQRFFFLQPAMFAAGGAVLLLAWVAHGQAKSIENKAESWKR